jgi:hypothetical protein
MDYMVAASHTHQPDLQQNGTPLSTNPLQDVADAFAAAPVNNPDGVTGITLHYTIDEPLIHIAVINFFKSSGAADDFYDFKSGSNDPNSPGTPCGVGTLDGHFGSVADRSSSNCPNILEARRAVYHYSISSHFLNGAPGAAGMAELHGNDFIMVLGSSLYSNFASKNAARWGTTFDAEWKDLYARVFMHELGHNFGLRHSGTDSTHGEPNYLGVMNYTRLFNYSGAALGIPGVADGTVVRVNPPLDYSRVNLPDLDEDNLDESAGIGGTGAELAVFGNVGAWLVAPTSGPIDWDMNGTIQSGTRADVNNIKGIANRSPGQVLAGQDDWSNLDYNFRDDVGYFDGDSLGDGRGNIGLARDTGTFAGVVRQNIALLFTADFDFTTPLNKRRNLSGRR